MKETSGWCFYIFFFKSFNTQVR